MSDQLQMFKEHNYQESTQSPSEVLAKISALLENVKEWTENDQALSLKQFDLFGNADQIFLSGKMLKERSAQTIAKTLRQSCKRLPTLGVIDLNGNCLIQNGFYPKTVSEFTLSDILETDVDDRYFLSEKTTQRLMSYKNKQQTPLPQDTELTESDRTLLKINSRHK